MSAPIDQEKIVSCRYGNAYHMPLYFTYSSLLWGRIRVRGAEGAYRKYRRLVLPAASFKIIRADYGELMSEFGTE